MQDRSHIALKARRELAPHQQTLWFDVGDLLWWRYSHVTGIQRAMLSILCQLRTAQNLPFAVRYCRYVSDNGFFEVDQQSIETCITRLTGLGTGTKKGVRHILPIYRIDQKAVNRIKAAIKVFLRKAFRRLPPEIAPQSRDLFYAAVTWFRACRLYGANGLKVVLRHRRIRNSCGPASSLESNKCQFSEGDILLNVGTSWINPGYMGGVGHAKNEHGLKYVAMIYDLIPWKFPQWFPVESVPQFVPWARQTIETADTLLAISENTKGDIQQFIEKVGLPRKTTTVVRLGATLLQTNGRTEPRRDSFKIPTENGYVLSLGTLEIRKNHQLLFHVWNRLLEKYGQDIPVMVWVGRWGGWLLGDLMNDLKRSNHLMGKLVILGGEKQIGVTDEELLYLYENCLFTLFPSYYEGWGLPVAESLACGKYCIASNSSSIPEVAGDLIDYHDPGDFNGCYELVERAIFDPDYRAKKEAEIRAKYRPHSWADCTNTITKIIESLFLGGAVDLLGLERPPTETGITG